MKKTIFTFMLLFFSASLFAGGSGKPIIIAPEKSPVTDKATQQDIINIKSNRKKIDHLFVKIDNQISKLAELSKEIASLIKNKDVLIACQALSGLKMESEALELEFKQLNSKDKDLERKLNHYRRVYKQEKNKLNAKKTPCYTEELK